MKILETRNRSDIDDKLVAWQLKYYEERDHIYCHPETDTLNDRALLNGFVLEQPSEKYAVNRESVKFLGTELYEELCGLMKELREINNSYASLEIKHVYSLVCKDLMLSNLRSKMTDWSQRYCLSRANKYNSKDNSSPFKKYIRLTSECDQLTDYIATVRNSINPMMMIKVVNYMIWLFYDLTVRPELEITASNGNIAARYNTKDLSKAEINILVRLYFHAQWFTPDYVSIRFRRLYSDGVVPDGIQSMSTEEKMMELQTLASDIYEIKPFLIRNYRPEKMRLEMGTQVLTWDWHFSEAMGVINFYDSDSRAYHGAVKGFTNLSLGLHGDGVLRLLHMPWINTIKLPAFEDFDPIDVNLTIVREIHQKLLTLYLKIDIDRILSPDKRNITDGANDEYAEAEIIAAACQVLAKEELEGLAESQNVREKRPVRQLRSSTFFRTLEKLGCEVRYGKGSEVTVFRVGGKKRRIGHHKANHHISSYMVGSILKQLNITRAEWFAAATRHYSASYDANLRKTPIRTVENASGGSGGYSW